MDGPTGVGFSPLPRNLRDKRGGGSAPADHSVFRFKTTKGNNDALNYWIVDCYYNYGARTKKLDDVELDKNQDWFDKFAALVIPFDDDPSIKPYDSLEDLQLAQSRYSQYVFPLYKFAAADDEDEAPVLKVETDLRMAPQIQVFE